MYVKNDREMILFNQYLYLEYVEIKVMIILFYCIKELFLIENFYEKNKNLQKNKISSKINKILWGKKITIIAKIFTSAAHLYF